MKATERSERERQRLQIRCDGEFVRTDQSKECRLT